MSVPDTSQADPVGSWIYNVGTQYKIQGPWFKNYEELQDGWNRTLNPEQSPGRSGPWTTLAACPGSHIAQNLAFDWA